MIYLNVRNQDHKGTLRQGTKMAFLRRRTVSKIGVLLLEQIGMSFAVPILGSEPFIQ